MAFYSLVIYAGNGSNRNFTIHFPYLDKSHVKAKIDSSQTTAFSWLTDSSIQFNTAPAAGANIEIYRETPLNASPVDFTDGSILLERDLDLLTTFNLYVDQEIADRASRALSAGKQDETTAVAAKVAVDAKVAAEAARDAAVSAKDTAEAAAIRASNAAQPTPTAQGATPGTAKVSNTDTTLDTLNNKLTVVAPLSKTVKNVGANEKLELSIDLSNYATKGSTTGGSGSDMSKYATLKANTFDGLQTMTGLTVKDSSIPGSAIVTLQASSDLNRATECGVRYANPSGTIKYQHYYTSENVAWHVLTDATSSYRWCFEIPFDVATAASLKRNRPEESRDPNYYSFNVGDQYNQSYGAALNIYGVAPRFPKLSMYISDIFRGGLVATNAELRHIAPSQHTLESVNGQTYFTIDESQATLVYSTTRNNSFQFVKDGNIALVRNGSVVWSVNNFLSSDARLKTDIKPLEGSSLEKVKQLSAKTYLWKDDLMGKGEKREIGFLAQDVVKVVPEVVSKMTSDAETLGVAYTQLIPVLVEAVKELSAKVEALEAQLETKK